MMPPPVSQSRILLVGCGKMGGALLNGWKTRHPNLSITIVDPASPDAQYRSASDIHDASFDAVVLAVKPQVMTHTIQEIRGLLSPTTLIISIAAGKPIAYFEELTHASQPIIRVMPNTPAAIGCGMSVLCSNPHVTSFQKELAALLLSSVGVAEWLDDERLMDAVTAVSGSGPAYVFHLIEALAKAGENSGLPPHLSMTLARQTVIGAGALCSVDVTTSVETLRQNVTSPGGTTEAALKILMNDARGLTEIMTRAVLAARDRGRELAKTQS